nr:hypothetical protein [uncultured Desulfuromonas sp.]
MNNKLSEFANQYYSVFRNRSLNLDSNDELPIGEFDRYTLGVSFSGIDEHYLNKAKEALSDIEEYGHGNDIFEKLDSMDLLKSNPKLISLFILKELQSHEFFHLLQTLLLPSCYSLYKASREMASLKVMIFGLYLKTGSKFSLNKELSIFEYLDSVSDDDIRGYLERFFDMYRYNTNIVDNFFSYSEKDTRVNMIDLMEGSAYFFQKLSNRTMSIDTFTPKKDSPYLVAHDHFTKCGGKENLLFVVLCHLALKYGILDDGDFMEIMPTPQDIFESLCNQVDRYNDYLSDIPFSFSLFGSYSPLEKLEKWGFSTEDRDHCLEKEMVGMSDEELYATGKIMGLCNIIEADVQKHFENARVKFKKSRIEPDETRASSIITKIRNDHAAFESYLFLSLLLANNTFSSTMLSGYLPKIKDVEYKGLFSENTNTLMDDNLFRLVDDIDSLLVNGVANCCQEHGSIPYRKLIACENKAGLNQRVENLVGIGLRGIFE